MIKQLHLIYKTTLIKLLSHPITIKQNHPSISNKPINIKKNHNRNNVKHLKKKQNKITYFNNHKYFNFQLIKNIIY